MRGEDYYAVGSLNVRYGVNMTGGSDSIGRDSGVWFDARVTRYVDKFTGTERVDSFTLNDPPTRVDYLEVNSAYPGPGRSENAVRRVQGRQREVNVDRTPDWTENTEQAISVSLLGAPIQVGKTQDVSFDLSSNTVSITTRTTDTPVYAWTLLESGEEWIDSPVGESWLDEVA